MIKRTLFFALSILMLASCTNREYKEGMTISKISVDGTIFTADGSEIALRPKGFEDATSIILVRHAEKEEGENPGLTSEGLARADRIAELVFPLDIQEVFMTEYKRTIFTARPLAMEHGLPVSTYNPEQYDRVVEKIFGKRAGGNVIIYGHSNTTPELTSLLSATTKMDNIPEGEYDNMYIVTSKGHGEESVVYKFKF